MRILIVGAGATDGYFGTRLVDAGRDVTFMVREQRAAFLQQSGLRVAGLEQELHVAPRLVPAGQPGGTFDVVVLAVNAAGLEGAIVDAAPAVGPETVIVPFLNGMAHLDALADAFGADKIMGSVVQLVGTINEDDDIAVLNTLARWAVGEPGGGMSARLERLLAEVSAPGIEVIAAPNGLQAMWQKWLFIVAAGVVTCLMRASVGDIAAVDGGAAVVADVVAETAAVAAAAGFVVSGAGHANTLAFLTEPGSSFTSPLYRDVTAGLPNDAEHMVGDFARRARSLGVQTPLFDLALLALRAHESGMARR